jgi:hypothetical protein
VVAAAITMPMAAQAQAETGAPVLDYPLSVRSVGMGSTGTADRFTPGNVYFNPANVTSVNGLYSTGSFELVNATSYADIWFGHLSLGGGYELARETPFLLAFDLTLTRLSYGTTIAMDSQGRWLAEYDSKEDYIALTAGFNTTISEGVDVAFGIAYKRLSLNYGPVQYSPDPEPAELSENMLDVGAVVSWFADAAGWRVRPAAGVALVNQGPDIDFGDGRTDPLPTWINYGVTVQVDAPTVKLGSTDVPPVSAALNFDGKHGLNEQRPTWGIGAEFAAMQMVFIRWGQLMDDLYHVPQMTWGAALGIPARSVRVRLEYANFIGLGPWTLRNVDKFGFTFVWLFDGGGSD